MNNNENLNLAKNKFFINYIEKMINCLKMSFPELPDEKLKEIVVNTIKEKVKNKNIIIENNYTNKSYKYTLHDLLNLSYNKNFIFTPYGTIFKTHKKAHNLNYDFLEYLKVSRSEKKNLKFEAMKTGDIHKENFFDMFQLAFKLLMNSYYGITKETSSQFYNEIIPASITYTGYALITTSIMAFEQFLANNIKITSLSNLINYFNNIINIKEYELNLKDYIDKDKLINKKEFLNYLKTIVSFNLSDYKEELINIINNLSIENINKIYFINNIYTFIKSSSKTFNLIKDTLENKNTDNYEEIWNILKNFVSYPFQTENRYNRIHTLERKFILGCDTDSNFCGLESWYDFIKENNINGDEFDIAHLAIYFLYNFINNEIMKKFTSDCNVPIEQQPLINMKSEFLFSRMMFTRNKKQYAGLLIEQEGNEFKEPKIELKGLSIKKSNVRPETRKFFISLIKDDILNNDNINLSYILNKYHNFENIIKDSLINGETVFLKSDKSNDIESYKLPYTIQSVRGTIIWNELYPNNTINTPTKVNILKLKVKTLEDLEKLMDIKKYNREYNIIKDIIFTSKPKKENDGSIVETNNLLKYGFEIIALPKSLEKIPEWLLPLVDYECIIKDTITVGNIILESLGFSLMKFNGSEYYSNFIKF